MQKLTERQARFVEEYLANGGDAANAARAAGFAESTARNAYAALLGSPAVESAIEARLEELKQEAMRRLGARVGEVVDALVALALSPDTPATAKQRACCEVLDRVGIARQGGEVLPRSDELGDFLDAVREARAEVEA